MCSRPLPISTSPRAFSTASPSSASPLSSTASARPTGAGCRSIAVLQVSRGDAAIEVRDLYKIFGRAPEKYVEAVRGGLSKAELGKTHGHILGLNNINISMPAGKI